MLVELAGSGSKVLVLTQAHMNPNRAPWGQHKKALRGQLVQAGPTCQVTEVSVKRKPWAAKLVSDTGWSRAALMGREGMLISPLLDSSP